MSTFGPSSSRICRCFALIALGLMLAVAVVYTGTRLERPLHEKQLELLDQIAQQQNCDDTLQQIQEIEKGQIDCLVNPAPGSIDQLVTNLGCRQNLTTIYMGRNVSDPRLARLQELPNLKRIVFFWTENPAVFLDRLRGNTSIESVSYDWSPVAREDGQCLADLPNLKSLCIPMDQIALECLRGHGSLEDLVLTRAMADKRLIPILQSMPKLRHLTLNTFDTPEQSHEFEGLLRHSLPQCECSMPSW